MGKPFILVGDSTSHGGKVIGGSPQSSVEGKPIARVGDAVTCPIKGHGGVSKIITGDPTCIIDGKPAARDGDVAACGAKLMASLQTFVTSGGGGGGGSGSSKAAKKTTAADDYKQNMESLKSEDSLGPVLDNDAATLVAGPAMLTGNPKADVLAWYITPYGKSQSYILANLATGKDKFYTVGNHSKGGGEIQIQDKYIVFFDGKNNCLGYSLGRPDKGQVVFKTLDGAAKFDVPLVRAQLQRIGGKIPAGYVAPFNQPIEAGFVALDMWSNKSLTLWHVTRRVAVGGQTIIISKDGNDQSVQNFTSQQLEESGVFRTNTGSILGIKPVYTMLIPTSEIGNWPLLSLIFKGS